MEAQTEAFETSAELIRDTDYFKEHIGEIDTAEDLVANRRLLRVALGAFGLQDDIDNKFFIQKVLSDGVLDDDSLANRMSDTRYQDLSRAFGFGDFDIPRSKDSEFGDKIVEKYQTRQFEVAVGNQDDDLRLAMYAKRELAAVAASDSSDDTKWFEIMGSEPLRQVIETALGLPDSISQLDLDQQLGIFRDAALRKFGDGEVAQFSDPEMVDDIVELFLLRSELEDVQLISSGSIALTLLQS